MISDVVLNEPDGSPPFLHDEALDAWAAGAEVLRTDLRVRQRLTSPPSVDPWIGDERPERCEVVSRRRTEEDAVTHDRLVSHAVIIARRTTAPDLPKRHRHAQPPLSAERARPALGVGQPAFPDTPAAPQQSFGRRRRGRLGHLAASASTSSATAVAVGMAAISVGDPRCARRGATRCRGPYARSARGPRRCDRAARRRCRSRPCAQRRRSPTGPRTAGSRAGVGRAPRRRARCQRRRERSRRRPGRADRPAGRTVPRGRWRAPLRGPPGRRGARSWRPRPRRDRPQQRTPRAKET